MTAAAAVLFVGVFIYAFNLEMSNTPPEGYRAPFANSNGKPVLDKNAVPEGIDLTIQHLSGREVGMRLTEIVAESLSFNRGDFVYNSGVMEKYFTPTAYAQYTQFLANSAFRQTLEERNLQSGAFVEQEPLELTSGVFNGAYKWLFEVPVTISFIPKDAESYRDENLVPINRRILLRAQFTRVDDAKDPDAVRIEIWEVLPPRPQP